MSNRIVRVYPNVSMQYGHRGLRLMAKKEVDLLDQGNFLLFMNKAQTAFKLFTRDLVVHYKHPRGRIDVRSLQYIPHCFGAGKFNFDVAVDKFLTKVLAK